MRKRGDRAVNIQCRDGLRLKFSIGSVSFDDSLEEVYFPEIMITYLTSTQKPICVDERREKTENLCNLVKQLF